MSWNQDYSVPSVESLLEKLTGFNSLELLKEELACQGILIKSEEEIVLDEGMYEEVKGTKITLSDGRVFVPKLVEKYTADGNYGNDVYEYVLEGETPEVKYVDANTTNPDVDVFTAPNGDNLKSYCANCGGDCNYDCASIDEALE